MPFSSKAQQRFMHARHPEIAKRWDKETNFKDLPMRTHKYGGGMIAESERRGRYPEDEYGGPVRMNAYGGGFVPRSENPGRYPSEEYGGPVRMGAYGGGMVARSEEPGRYPEDEYGGPVHENMAHGGKVECPNCGHRFAHGGMARSAKPGHHMTPGYDGMDPDEAAEEEDLNLGHALQRKRYRGF